MFSVKGVGADFLVAVVPGHEVDERDTGSPAPVEQTRIGGDRTGGAVRRHRHGSDRHIRLLAVQVDIDKGRLGMVHAQVHQLRP